MSGLLLKKLHFLPNTPAQWGGLEKRTEVSIYFSLSPCPAHYLWWVGGRDCGGYLKNIYIFILINYPHCVQCTIINPTTFPLKADFLIWWFYFETLTMPKHKCKSTPKLKTKIFMFWQNRKEMRIPVFGLSIFMKSGNNAISAKEWTFHAVKHHQDCTSAMLT